MPFRSRSQQRWMFSAESKGELPKGTALRWAHHTPDMKGLPEHAHEKDKHKEHKKAVLLDLVRSGNQTAILISQVLKEASIGRNEGFGATNGAMTASSNLLSPTTLGKPPAGPAGLPGASSPSMAPPSGARLGGQQLGPGMNSSTPASIVPQAPPIPKAPSPPQAQAIPTGQQGREGFRPVGGLTSL